MEDNAQSAVGTSANHTSARPTATYVNVPQCRGDLIAAPPPNGRSSSQTIRLNKPLVHVLVFKEGSAPPRRFLQELFQNVAPDVLEDSPTAVCVPSGKKWPETPVDAAMAILARDHSEYLGKEYDMRPVELSKNDGTRMVILKVFANRPKIVDPTDPAQRTKIVAPPVSAQKQNSGLFSTFLSRLRSG